MRKAWHRAQGDYRRRFRGYGDTAREQASIRAADDTKSERDMGEDRLSELARQLAVALVASKYHTVTIEATPMGGWTITYETDFPYGLAGL
jgi:hypothetical protein